MPCHHCGKARRSVVDAVKAATKGDAAHAIDAAKDAVEHVKAKVRGKAEGGRG